MSKGSRTKLYFYIFGSLISLSGLWGIYQRFFIGEREVNYGSYVVWGLWVAMYLFFAGVATGAFMIASLDHLFEIKLFKGTGTIALWGSVVTMPAALASIGMDLGHMERIIKVFLQPNIYSVMAQLVWGYSVFFVISVISLLNVLNTGSKFRISKGLFRTIMSIGFFLAIFLSGGVGALLGVNAGRESWHTAMLPAQFPVFSLMSGLALMLIILGWFMPTDNVRRPSQLRYLSITLALLLVVKLYYLWTDYSQALYTSSPNVQQAVQMVLFGRFGWAFWILQLGFGMIIPFIFLIQGRFNQSNFWSGIFGVLVLIGMGVARANIIFPALSIPELQGLAVAFYGPHLGYDYFPSSMEWFVTLGVIGSATLAFLIGTDYLPLFPEKKQEVAQ